MRSLIFSLILFTSASLFGEIDFVQLYWTPELCRDDCGKTLIAHFEKIKAIQNYDLSIPQGRATLYWRPNFPFSFSTINSAMRLVGLKVLNTRVRVVGTISITRNKISLVSLGDRTRFILINKISPVYGEQVVASSLENRGFTRSQSKEFQILSEERTLVQVEGPLFLPARYITPHLIVDQLRPLER